MAAAPWAALGHLPALKGNVSGAELRLDEGGDGAALDESGERETLMTEAGRNVQQVGLGAGRLHIKPIAALAPASTSSPWALFALETVTSYPALSRFFAMGLPMMPSPINPIFIVALSFVDIHNSFCDLT